MQTATKRFLPIDGVPAANRDSREARGDGDRYARTRTGGANLVCANGGAL